MIPTMPTPLHSLARPLAFVVALLVAPASALLAQDPPKKEISDEVSAAFGKLRELTDAKNFTAAVAQLDALLSSAPADSYDRALVAQIQSQILLADGKFSAAVAPLEIALDLGERHAFFAPAALQDQRYLLAQLHCQLAAEHKDPADQRLAYDRARDVLRRWFAAAPRPTADACLLSASILYNRATLAAGKPDADLLREARAEAERGLGLQPKPNLQLYILLLASLQQLGEISASADILELLVKQRPDSATYWQQLAATYLNLAADAKDEPESRRQYLRAILAFERAQTRGLLSSPKDRFNLVAIYFNIQQFDRAAALLETQLASDSPENARRGWELLASAYQQLRQDDRAVDAYQRALRAFPQDGQLEFALAQFHYSQNRAEAAYRHLENAAAKGGLAKPGQSALFSAYVACELQRYESAARWLESAARHDDAKKDELARLDRVVRDALRERAALRDAKI